MADVIDEPVTAPATAPLRIVLFGMPEAGKSSLLAAMVKAFGSALVEPPGDKSLSQLGKDAAAETRDEVVTYPAKIEGSEVVFIDCDGQAAMRILTQQDGPDSKLAQEIRQADVLLLAVDASATDEKLEEHFAPFVQFLHLLEESRGAQSDVAGLPVYLVLTKCDRLAEKNTTRADWEKKIAERQAQVESAFEEFLAQREAEDHAGFGSIDLDVKATAVRPSALTDTKAAASHGVAELFQEAIQAATDYSERNRSAASRLRVTLVSALSLLAVMLFGALLVFAMRPAPEVAALENAIRTLLPRSASSAERLKEADEKLKDVEDVLANPYFAQLPVKAKEEVEAYHKELQAFARYNKDFLDQVRDPRLARTEAELDKIEDAMKRSPLPQSYAADWGATIAGRRLQQYGIDVKTLRDQIPLAEKAFQELDKKREDLASVTVKEYPQKRKELIAEAEKLPYFQERNKRLPGSNITYDQVLHFDKVLPWFRKWEAFRKGPVIGS